MRTANYARGLRFLPIVAFITTVGFLSANAQSVYTSPVGFITQTAVGGGVAFWGLPMTQLPVQVGNVGTIISNEMTDTSGSWTGGQFNVTGQGAPCEIEFLSPTGSTTNYQYAGLIDEVVATVAPNIVYTSDQNDGSLIAAGYRYQIRPSWTCNTLFGTSNQAGLQGGTGSANADDIEVWNPNTQTYATTYYYKTNSGGGGVGWRTTASSTVNAGTNVLYLDQGVLINRRGSTNVNVQLVGAVKYADVNEASVGQTIVPVVQSGVSIVGYVYSSSFTMGSVNLYNGSTLTGLQGGTGSANADDVELWNPVSQTFATTYYYKTNAGGGGVGWRTTASSTVDASTNVIPLGTSLLINRRNANPFNWTPSQPF